MVALSGSPIREIRRKKEPLLLAASDSPVAAPPRMKSVVINFQSFGSPSASLRLRGTIPSPTSTAPLASPGSLCLLTLSP